ncbi:MAG: endolytic transglycosylase MltG [Proteobacteria bacterium]|nr:endolytic transglycosylase MltG [Pseudomonadota bacterium]
MKKLFITIIIITTIAAVVSYNYYQQYNVFLQTSVFKKNKVINITKGQNFKGFTQYLMENGANGQAWQWRLFAKLEKVGQWLKIGEFEIQANFTPLQMMQKIEANQVISYNFTIIEGMMWRELKYKILANPLLIKTLNDVTDEQLLLKLNSDKISLEGLFLPETYQFVRGNTDFDILNRAHVALKQGLNKVWLNKKANLPLKNSYELLTLASIVEKETAIANERDEIAGVFIRRLQLNMRLQTDPTVIYGLGENYDGDIKSKDLKTDTPYNTYTRKGLTPTPIAMASIESIKASANPKDGTFLYFVANNRGGHYFSDTYEQHSQAVKKYLQGTKL